MDTSKHALFRGRIVPYADAKVGVLTHSFNFGTAVIAGIRGYWNADEHEMYLFRPHDHYRRFLRSAKIMCMDLGQTPESLTQLTIELIRAEAFERDIYVRPIAYKADESIGVRLHDLRDELAMVTFPFDFYMKNDTALHVTVSSWRRVDDNIIPARGKISGAYANSALMKTDAVRSGFDEALALSQDGHLSEGSAMNVFLVMNGVLVTPRITDNILEGITRASVIELAQKELGLRVVERSVDRSEIYTADELFFTGTAAQIAAITRVDHRAVGSGTMGPITTRLRTVFEDIVRHRKAAAEQWTVPVYR